MMPDPRPRLLALLQRLAPDVAVKLWRVDDVCELPREDREAIVDVLGCECAERGFDEDDDPNAYGEELEAPRFFLSASSSASRTKS